MQAQTWTRNLCIYLSFSMVSWRLISILDCSWKMQALSPERKQSWKLPKTLFSKWQMWSRHLLPPEASLGHWLLERKMLVKLQNWAAPAVQCPGALSCPALTDTWVRNAAFVHKYQLQGLNWQMVLSRVFSSPDAFASCFSSVLLLHYLQHLDIWAPKLKLTLKPK